jgi:hypothetical protein
VRGARHRGAGGPLGGMWATTGGRRKWVGPRKGDELAGAL